VSAWAARFARFSTACGVWTGHPLAFIASLVLVLVWAISGPLFGFSDTWQLVINTFTTVVTYLLVFVIQNSQNRSDKATQLKLDELIVKLEAADNRFAGIEQRTEAELDRLGRQMQREASDTG